MVEGGAMHPWIAGRIVTTLQEEARRHAAEARTGRALVSPPRRRERLGLAVARVGLRIAGRASPTATAGQRWNGGWSTCAVAPPPRRA
jgi:hypothetical protein